MTSWNPSLRAQHAGFTLLEVIVGLAVLSLATTLLYQALWTASSIWRSTTLQAQELNELATAQRFLRRSIESMYPMLLSPRRSSRSSVNGTDDMLEYMTHRLTAQGRGGFHLVQVRLFSVGSETFLGLRWQVDSRADQLAGPLWSEPEPILRRVSEVRFEYWDSQQRRWTSTWLDQQGTPGLVRVHLARTTPDLATWPALTIAPRLKGDANCDFDSVGNRCIGIPP